MVTGFWSSRLRDLRGKAQLTERDLAQLIGCDEVTVYNWEAGRFSPSPSNLLRLAMIFGVPTGELLDISESQTDLRGLRERAGLALAPAAGRLGIRSDALSRIERGRQDLPDTMLEALASTYGVTRGQIRAAWLRSQEHFQQELQRRRAHYERIMSGDE